MHLQPVCPCYTPRRQGGHESEHNLGCIVLGPSQFGGGQSPPGGLHCQFSSAETKTVQFSQVNPAIPSPQLHHYQACHNHPSLSFTFNCFVAIRDVIPATCPAGQPVPASSPKVHHINECCATAGWICLRLPLPAR